MELKKDHKEEKHSSVILEDRNKMSLTGVVEVIRFDDEEINLNTIVGRLLIKGEKLKMHKLDVQNGEVVVTGVINSFVYRGKKDENIISKLFK